MWTASPGGAGLHPARKTSREFASVICPTCQTFWRDRQTIHASNHLATLHGVVFDILVGARDAARLAVAKHGLPSRSSRPRPPLPASPSPLSFHSSYAGHASP